MTPQRHMPPEWETDVPKANGLKPVERQSTSMPAIEPSRPFLRWKAAGAEPDDWTRHHPVSFYKQVAIRATFIALLLHKAMTTTVCAGSSAPT